MQKKENLIFVISGPSGSGKTSVIDKLLENDSLLRVAVSATTRPKRPLEIDGKDYYFMSKKNFEKHLEQKNFAEHACVYGNFYGTLKSEIEKIGQAGCDLLFNKDYQGLQNLKKHYKIIGIFIKPPSLSVLKERLENRNQDSQEIIQRRLEAAEKTLKDASFYDYVVINDNLESCTQEICQIIKKARIAT